MHDWHILYSVYLGRILAKQADCYSQKELADAEAMDAAMITAEMKEEDAMWARDKKHRERKNKARARKAGA